MSKELRIDLDELNAKFERIRESCITTQHRKSFNNFRRTYNKIIGEWFSKAMFCYYLPSAAAIALFIVIMLACILTPILNEIFKHF
jgi:hypothetical protein